MSTLIHHPETTDPASGLSSECTIVGDLVFSTQIPLDADGGLPEGAAAQSELVLANLRDALEAVGSGLAGVAHLTIYLTRMADRAEFNAAYEAAFSRPFPVRAAVEVSALARPGMLVEVTAIAARG
jgi:enamine deaminase RidA (YjgF/YER057c/UK114 family)